MKILVCISHVPDTTSKINFANNLANNTYAIFANGRENNKSVQPEYGGVATSHFQVKAFDADTASLEDIARVNAIVFGDD